MLRLANCPVCHKEVEISEGLEAASTGCPVCGKGVTFFTCPYCDSEFTSADIGETSECAAQGT